MVDRHFRHVECLRSLPQIIEERVSALAWDRKDCPEFTTGSATTMSQKMNYSVRALNKFLASSVGNYLQIEELFDPYIVECLDTRFRIAANCTVLSIAAHQCLHIG